MSEPAAASPLELRLARSDEAPAILDYYRAQLKAGVRVADVMRWRAGDAASGGNAPAVAVRDGTLFGIVNSVPATLTLSGKRFKAAWQGDSVVSPELRGQGVAKKLVHAASPEAVVVLAKGTVPAMYGLRKSVGFEDVGNAEYLVRGLGFKGGSAKRTLRNGILGAWAGLRSAGAPRGEAREAGEFGPDFDELDQRLAALDEVRIAKNAGYLRWRYGNAPGRRYRVFRSDAGGALRGAAVLRDAGEPGGDAWLVDVIADPGDAATLNALVSAVLRTASAAGAGAIRAFATSPRVREVLFRHGFLRTRDTPRFTRWIKDPAASAVTQAPWNVSHGDGDIELY